MDKLICKVRIPHNTCCGCIDDQIRAHDYKSCECCELRDREYEILKVGHSLFIGDWAMVLGPDGKIGRVALDRVYDVKNVFIGVDFANCGGKGEKYDKL